MIRFASIISLLTLVACADRSKGAALSECRLKYYLDSPTAQGEHITDCMKAKSFDAVIACNPVPDEDEWDWQVKAFAYNDPRCYHPLGSTAWIATALSPM